MELKQQKSSLLLSVLVCKSSTVQGYVGVLASENYFKDCLSLSGMLGLENVLS